MKRFIPFFCRSRGNGKFKRTVARKPMRLLVFVPALFLFCFPTEFGQIPEKEFVPIQGIEVVKAKIGSGPDDIGAITPPEAAPLGPMSFALGKKGEVYILDQLNSRIQVFEKGKRTKTLPLPATTFKDIALTPAEKIVLLDSDVKESLYILDARGDIVNVIPLVGELVPSALLVSSIQVVEAGTFAGIWVEVEESSVQLASLDGQTAKRISAPGKFSLNGQRLLSAQIIGEATACVYRSEERSFSRWEPEFTVFFNRYIVHLFGPWDDRREWIYLVAYLEDATEKGEAKYSQGVVVLDPEGDEQGRWQIDLPKTPHEIWSPFRVSREGHLYQLMVDDQNVLVLKYELNSGSGRVRENPQSSRGVGPPVRSL